MTDEAAQREMDAEEHRNSFKGIMRASGEIGVPFALALTMFFTQLTMANGIGLAIIAAAITYFAVYFIVKTFFSH